MKGLDIGERVPNFIRLSSEGKSLQLDNDIHVGQPLVLWLFPDPEHAGLAGAVRQLQAEHPFWNTVTPLVFTPMDPQNSALFAADQALTQTVLADDGSLIRFLAGDESQPAIVGLALDNRLRVIARHEFPNSDNAYPEELEKLYRAEPRVDRKVADTPAPILIIPRVFEPEFCDELIARFDAEGGKPSGVLVHEGDKQILVPDPETKDRSDYYFPQADALFMQMRDRVMRRVLPEIRQYFNFSVTAHDPFRLICYDSATGGYFRPHRDNVTADVAHRKFALTINLNTDEYTGGELQFAEFGQQLYSPEKGAAVIFSCSMVHEAMPVTKGKRYAIVGFFYNDSEK